MIRNRSTAKDRLIACLLVLVSALLVGPMLRLGWVPSDEGTLAQSALRVYEGQLPHRDFAEIYTGGLSFWHALAFRLLGVNLLSLRVATFVLFLLWVPAVYYLARRTLSHWGAFFVGIAAVAWSYVNYVAAMPSWYNLFLSTWGMVALLRFSDTGRGGWLVLAGACAGLCVLVKVTGLYFVAAALIWFAWIEQEEAARETSAETSVTLNGPPANIAFWLYRSLSGLGFLVFLISLMRLLSGHIRSGEIYSLLLPSWMCVGLWFWSEFESGRIKRRHRFLRLFKMAGPFFFGWVGVLAVFAAPYLRSGSFGALMGGVFGSTANRVEQLAGRASVPSAGYAMYSLVLMALVALAIWWPVYAARRIVLVASAFVLLAVVTVSFALPGLQDTWMMAGMATPLVVAIGVWRLLKGELRGRQARTASLMIAVAAVYSLVQFPVGYVTYFCYIAPLVLLTGVACTGDRRRPLLAVVLGFLLLLGLFGVACKHVYNPELKLSQTRPLTMVRSGGLRVDDTQTMYTEVMPVLQAHAKNGMMYAGNDCPELYFLSGLTNVTRDDTGAKADEILDAMRSGRLHLIVLNDAPFFATSAIPAQVRSEVVRRYPHVQKLGKFSIFWD